MWKNYFLVAIRYFYRNKYHTLINIVGLGVAMALCVVGYANYRFSQSFNSGHRNVDRIYALAGYNRGEGQRYSIMQNPTPLAPSIAADVPGVVNYSRLSVDVGDVRSGDKIFKEDLWFVDPSFFDMFTFDLRQGAPGTLADDPSAAIITADVARRFFGDETAVGRQLTIAMSNQKSESFIVQAVVATPPLNSSFMGGVYLDFRRQADIFGYNPESWADWTTASFLMLDDKTPIEQVSAALDNYVARAKAANPDSDGFFLTPMRDLGALSRDIGGVLRAGMHTAAIMMPSVVAFLILLLACFNFMNTSIAFAAGRVKEIGVRKVFGSIRRQLVWQFLGENLLLCFLALMLAVALAEILVPAYNNLWPGLDLSFSYANGAALIGCLLPLVLFTGVAAGLYPALYISRFSPIAIFRGRQKVGGTNTLIRVLLTLQLSIATASIMAVVILTRNAAFIRDFDYGYQVADILVVPVQDGNQYDVIHTAAMNDPGVLSAGPTEQLMMRAWGVANVGIDGRDVAVNSYRFGDNYSDVLRLNIIQGRSFDSSLTGDRDQAVMVNRALVTQAGWTNPLEKTITFNINNVKKDYRVIGVVNDFYPNGINSKVRPAVIKLASRDQYRYALVRVRPGSDQAVNAHLERVWHEHFPNAAYAGFWHDERMQQNLRTNNNIMIVLSCMAVVATVIASMGLASLVSLNLAKRTREIGVRKVLGATAVNISVLAAREFVIMIAIGGGLATGLGYFLTDKLLSAMWTRHCDFGVLPVVLSIAVIVGMTGLSVGYRVLTAARANPIEALRYE